MENVLAQETKIPDKLYFKIGEVSAITGLADYVLRFWESEFRTISPKRTDSGQRLYRQADIRTILTIKELLYEKKFTIEGARKYLEKSRRPNPGTANQTGNHTGTYLDIEQIRAELLDIRKLLDE